MPERNALALRSTEHWNHNTHYHRLVPHVAPPPWGRVLDVGCGEGLLTRRLAPLADEVTGVDPSPEMIGRARAAADTAGMAARSAPRYVQGDVLTADLPGPYDLVTCFAVLHHMDLHRGLARLAELTAPGGTLLVVGLAPPSSGLGWLVGGLGVLANHWARRRRGEWDPQVPVADATATDGEVRRAARALLPGSTFRHRLYWRYSLVWHRPPLSGSVLPGPLEAPTGA